MKKQSTGIAVIGIGLIGGSIIRDLKKLSHPFGTIYGVDSDPSALEAKQRRFIKQILSYEELPDHVTFIVIASPISTIKDVAQKINDAFNSSVITTKVTVIDVASVKLSISKTFEKLTNDTIEFVATHPMAGTEFSGLDHARLGLFRSKPWIICPHNKNTEYGINSAQTFIRLFGARIKEIDAAKHDKYAAVVSHTTILLSNYIFDFLSSNYPEALELAGSGFDSTTRLASGNPDLHNSIMKNNSKIVDEIIKEFSLFLAEKPSVGNLPASYFKENQENRDRWVRTKTVTSTK